MKLVGLTDEGMEDFNSFPLKAVKVFFENYQQSDCHWQLAKLLSHSFKGGFTALHPKDQMELIGFYKDLLNLINAVHDKKEEITALYHG